MTCRFCCSVGLIPIGGPGFAALVKGQQHETAPSGWLLAQTLPLLATTSI